MEAGDEFPVSDACFIFLILAVANFDRHRNSTPGMNITLGSMQVNLRNTSTLITQNVLSNMLCAQGNSS